MKYSRFQLNGYSPGNVWPWGSAGNIIAVGSSPTGEVTIKSIESHPDGCIIVTAANRSHKEPMKVAIYGQGQGTIIEEDLRCEICHEYFKNEAGLVNHRRSHKEFSNAAQESGAGRVPKAS